MDLSLSVTEPAPAKLNLALHVTGRRADGYHLLESLVVFTRLGDRVSARAAAGDAFAVAGPFAAALAADHGGNLVTRARDALRGAGHAVPPVALRLDKRLPVASGIGGGSSDAAAALRALCRLWGLDLRPERLAALGLGLGADVPMCLAARPLVARGVGEVLEPVDGLPPLALVLANPGVAVPTPAVFAALSIRENPPLPPLPARPDFRRLAEWLAAARNDLETPAAAVAPAVAEALAALRAEGAALARMSGSGATCFGLFSTPAEAERAAAAIRGARPGWFVAVTETL